MVNFYKLHYNILKLQHIISEGDKIMEQKTPFKELTFSQKIQYIWDYYKIPIFLVIIGIIAVTSFIHGRLAQKNTVLSVLCVNVENSTTEDSGADIFNDFLTDNGYDLSKDEIALDKNICVNVDKNGLDYQNMAVLTAYFASNEYDICFMDDKTFDYYAKNVCFEDISKYLDKAVLEKYKDKLTYATIDGTEYPCGIRLSADDNEFVKASGLYSSCTVGVCCDSSHDAMVKKLCGYILQ